MPIRPSTPPALNPTGTLRITASLSFCMQHIAPLLREYTERYPNVDGARGGGQPLPRPDRQQHRRRDPHPRVRARLQHHHPAAWRRRGASWPRRRATSIGAACRRARRPGAPRPADLHLRQQSRRTALHAATARPARVTVKGLLESNDGQVLRAAALDGLGILVQPTLHPLRRHRGRPPGAGARRVGPAAPDASTSPIQSRKHLSAKVRTFIDFMAEHFERMDYERKWTS